MASVIKSPGIEGSAYSLDCGIAKVGVPRAERVGKTSTAVSDVSPQERTARYEDDAATSLEETIRKRVDDAVSRQVQELHAQQLAEEEALFAAASVRGFQEGIRRADGAIASQQEGMQKQLALLEEGIAKAVDAAFSNTADLACEIAFEAVLKILGREIASGEAVAALTRELVGRACAGSAIVLRVHPADADLLDARIETSVPTRYRVEADDSLTRGGCVIDTPRGIVDARLETRLEAFIAALRGGPSEHPEALP